MPECLFIIINLIPCSAKHLNNFFSKYIGQGLGCTKLISQQVYSNLVKSQKHYERIKRRNKFFVLIAGYIVDAYILHMGKDYERAYIGHVAKFFPLSCPFVYVIYWKRLCFRRQNIKPRLSPTHVYFIFSIDQYYLYRRTNMRKLNA